MTCSHINIISNLGLVANTGLLLNKPFPFYSWSHTHYLASSQVGVWVVASRMWTEMILSYSGPENYPHASLYSLSLSPSTTWIQRRMRASLYWIHILEEAWVSEWLLWNRTPPHPSPKAFIGLCFCLGEKYVFIVLDLWYLGGVSYYNC